MNNVRDSKRWKLEARLHGEVTANALAIGRIFQNDHYQRIKRENLKIEKWREYISKGQLDDLVVTAKDLFEAIETEVKGKIRFLPGARVWDEGIYRCVDFTGKSKKGIPISWYAKGTDELRKNLHNSSDVEIEIWRRLHHQKPISKGVTVFGTELSPAILTEYFSESKYHRDFGSTNGMPRRVESVYNHIPSLKRPLKVIGFPYPHKVSNIMIG